jgi:hypothetical protein
MNAGPYNAAVIAALVLFGSSIAGCSSETEPTPSPTASPTAAAPAAAATTGPAGGPQEVRLGLATVDLGVGLNRFAFGVRGADSKPIRKPTALATFMFIESTPYEVRAQAEASFVTWPTGRAGVYVVDGVDLDKAGRWGLVVEVETEDGAIAVGQLGFDVKLTSSSPAIGSLAPRSLNKVGGDGTDLKEITTSPEPDPDLYRMTVADAIAEGRPAVVTFATPAFCSTATCGPQVEVVSALNDRYAGEASFIHVEVYDNPVEMRGDFSKGRISPVLEEWGLISEPYTFILDGEGVIRSKFEGFVTENELEAALKEVLG